MVALVILEVLDPIELRIGHREVEVAEATFVSYDWHVEDDIIFVQRKKGAWSKLEQVGHLSLAWRHFQR